MAIDERARHELYLRLEQSLGPEAANTLMEHLPPVGWADVATKRDLDLLRAEMAILRADLRGEMANLRADLTRTMVVTSVSTTVGAVLAAAGIVLAAVRLG